MRVDVDEAEPILNDLVDRALRGEEVVITRHGTPVARVVPLAASGTLASARGIWRGKVTIADDFDELPEDVAESFGAS